MEQQQFLQILQQEIAPAIGCTEPIAVAYAVAKAKSYVVGNAEQITVHVSSNMMKNAMGVGIPGTGMAGIDLAAALGVFGGDADAVLEVLHKITPGDVESAKEFIRDNVHILLKDTPEKLYIEAIVQGAQDTATVVIRGKHTNITTVIKNGEILYDASRADGAQTLQGERDALSVENIYRFAREVPVEQLSFLEQCIAVNRLIAEEGVQGEYGLRVGKTAFEDVSHSGTFDDACGYAVALASAAADARMSGCTLPVMTVCGSGNQGITATLPVIAACDYYQYSQEQLYRAVALSCLTTVHVKRYLGKLSPICGCGMGSAIGVCAAITYLKGGTLQQIKAAIQNVIADVSGIICDGAKAGCALKVATVITSAFRGAKLALKGLGAGNLDGIVSEEVERSIQNIGRLGNEGMANTDRVILEMMVCKA